jgi:glucose-6-phosphate dehydrogenase assembly protein OpcA
VICHDKVAITFGTMSALRASSVIGALALSEVPTIFEVGKGAPPALVGELSKVAARVVVDSSHTSVTRIAEIARATRAPVADRAMVRAFSWRELIARFFDEAPDAAFAVRAVEIERTPGGAQEPAALLLGWLGARLGWTFEAKTEACGKGGIRIAIRLADTARSDLGPGEITSIQITSEIDGVELVGRCERSGDPRVVAWSLDGARKTSHQHALGYRDETWVLLKAIDATEGDVVYKETVVKAAEWRAR